MADFNSIVGSVFKGGQGVTVAVLIIFGVLGVIGTIAISLFSWWYFKRRYNLKVEIKKIRSDGKIVLGEWGIGLFNAKKGVLMVKRKRMGAVPVKIIDIRKYLQGEDLLTVIQVGPRDYRPVLADSWTEYIEEYKDEKTGELVKVKESVLNIKVDSADNKAWESAYENSTKQAYSIKSFMQQFQVPISIAIVLISVFTGFAIIWTKIGSVCK